MNLRTRAIAAVVFCASGLTGCAGDAEPTEQPIFDTQVMSEQVACADTWAQLCDPVDAMAIEIYVADLLDQLQASGGIIELALGQTTDVTLSLVHASPIADNYCTDALVPREVHSTSPATSGVLRVTEESSGGEPTVTLLLEDVVISIDGQSQVLSRTERTGLVVWQYWGG